MLYFIYLIQNELRITWLLKLSLLYLYSLIHKVVLQGIKNKLIKVPCK